MYVGFFFAGTLTAWTTPEGSAPARYLIPIVPFLYFYLLQGALGLSRRTFIGAPKRVPVVLFALVSFILVISVVRNLQDWQNPIRNRMRDLRAGAGWILANTLENSIIMAADPVPDYLYERRRTVAYPRDGSDIDASIATNSVSFIMLASKLEVPRNELDDFMKSELIPRLRSDESRFRLVHSDADNNILIYQVLDQPTPPPNW